MTLPQQQSLQFIEAILVADYVPGKGPQLAVQYPQSFSDQFQQQKQHLADVILPEGSELRDDDWIYFTILNNGGVIKVEKSTMEDAQEPIQLDQSDNQYQVQIFKFDERKQEYSDSMFVKAELRIVEGGIQILSSSYIVLNNYIRWGEDCNFQVGNINSQCMTLNFGSCSLRIRFIVKSEFLTAKLQLSALQSADELDDETVDGGLLYGISLMRSRTDSSGQKLHKSLAIISKCQFVSSFKPLLVLSLEKYFQNPSADKLQTLYQTINSHELSLVYPQLTKNQRTLLRGGCSTVLYDDETKNCISSVNGYLYMPQFSRPAHQISRYSEFIRLSKDKVAKNSAVINFDGTNYQFEAKIVIDGKNVPLKLPITLYPVEIGEQSLMQLISILHPKPVADEVPPLMLLIHSVLSERRILFLGAKKSAGEISRLVFAFAALFTPMIENIQSRLLPSVPLTMVDQLLSVSGYIAGAANPIFEMHQDWWDVIVDLNSGKVQFSSQLNSRSPYGFTDDVSNAAQNAGYSVANLSKVAPAADQDLFQNSDKEQQLVSEDCKFMKVVMQMVQSRSTESDVRQYLRDYVSRFLRICSSYIYEQSIHHGQSGALSQLSNIKSKSSDLIEIPNAIQMPPTIGAREIFASSDDQKIQLDLYAIRVVQFRRTSTFQQLQKSYAQRLNLYLERYRNKTFTKSQVAQDPVLKNLVEYLQQVADKGSQSKAANSAANNAGKAQRKRSMSIKQPQLQPQTLVAKAGAGDSDPSSAVQSRAVDLYLPEQIAQIFKSANDLSTQEVSDFYKALYRMAEQSEKATLLLLEDFSLKDGGLAQLSIGLFHTDGSVRRLCTQFLQSVGECDRVGSTFVDMLNPIFHIAYSCQQDEYADEPYKAAYSSVDQSVDTLSSSVTASYESIVSGRGNIAESHDVLATPGYVDKHLQQTKWHVPEDVATQSTPQLHSDQSQGESVSYGGETMIDIKEILQMKTNEIGKMRQRKLSKSQPSILNQLQQTGQLGGVVSKSTQVPAEEGKKKKKIADHFNKSLRSLSKSLTRLTSRSKSSLGKGSSDNSEAADSLHDLPSGNGRVQVDDDRSDHQSSITDSGEVFFDEDQMSPIVSRNF
ncbi:hypothetical protein MP228_007098 [Amoeboaphelidium protococcarum]|nr:hypothetical protein MP228_007098 [Amoeboaphelidium protococcarum]